MMLEKENEHFQRAEARALEAEAERAKELALETARREKEELEEKARREKQELEEKLQAAEKAAAAEKAEAEKAQMIAAAEKAALKALLDQKAAEGEAERRRRQEQLTQLQQSRPASVRGRSFDHASLRRGCVTIDEEPEVIESPRASRSKSRSTSQPANQRP